MDSDDESDVWLVGKVTKDEYYSIIDLKKSIQEIYKRKGGFELFSIRKMYDNEAVSLVYDGDKWLSHLSEKPVYAECKAIDDVESQTLTAARESGSATFDIRLFPGSDRHSVPQHILSSLCSSFSSLFSAVSGERRSGRISVSTLNGSCIVRFSISDRINLSDDGNVVDEINILNDALSSDKIDDGIREVKDKRRFIRSYSDFLKTISKTDCDTQIALASPNSFNVSRIDLRSDAIKRRYENVRDIYSIEKEEVVLEGLLIALDIKSKKFKFQKDDESVISGRVDEKILESTRYEIPKRYTASISVEKHIDKNGSENNFRYFLNSLS